MMDITKACEKFTRKQNLKVLKFIHGLGAKIAEHADGSRINLDKMKEEDLAQVRKLIKELDTVETLFKIE
jgi:hypothetical protein